MEDSIHEKIIEEMKKHVSEEIAKGIKAHVNGKIDNLTLICQEANEKSKTAAEVAYYASAENVRMNKEMQKSLDEMKKNSLKMHTENQEGIKNLNELLQPFKDVKATGKVMKWVILTVTMVTGMLIGLKTLFPKLW